MLLTILNLMFQNATNDFEAEVAATMAAALNN